MQGFFRQPDVGSIDLGRFFASVHLHPVDFLLAAVGLGHSGIHHLQHDRRDVRARTVTFNKRNDRLVLHIQRIVGIDGNFLTLGGHLDVLVHVEKSPVSAEIGSVAKLQGAGY